MLDASETCKDFSSFMNALLNAGRIASSTINPLVNDLCDAIIKRDVQEVKSLLAKGADPNEYSISSTTACMVASTHGNAEILELLNNAGGDFFKNDKDGNRNSLMRAVVNGNFDAVEFLLKHGLDPNYKDHQQRTAIMKTPFCFYRTIPNAVQQITIIDSNIIQQITRVLLQYGAKIDYINENKESPVVLLMNSYPFSSDCNHLKAIMIGEMILSLIIKGTQSELEQWHKDLKCIPSAILQEGVKYVYEHYKEHFKSFPSNVFPQHLYTHSQTLFLLSAMAYERNVKSDDTTHTGLMKDVRKKILNFYTKQLTKLLPSTELQAAVEYQQVNDTPSF